MLSVTELQVPDLAYEEFIVEQTFITENKRIRKRTQEQHCSYYLQERMGGAKVERQLKNREYMALLATARNNNKPTITKVPTHPPPLPSPPLPSRPLPSPPLHTLSHLLLLSRLRPSPRT
jgi:hypothetical protein